MRFREDGRLSTDAKIGIVLVLGNALGAILVTIFFSVIEAPFSWSNNFEADAGIDRYQIAFFVLTFSIALVIATILTSKLDKPISNYTE